MTAVQPRLYSDTLKTVNKTMARCFFFLRHISEPGGQVKEMQACSLAHKNAHVGVTKAMW